MSFPSGSFRIPPNLRIRRVSEWRKWLVYTPSRPGLHHVNVTAYVVMQICDGREVTAIFQEFRTLAGPDAPEQDVRQYFVAALAMLERHGLIERVPG